MSTGSISAPKYQKGDLVWAKMKGFSPWPGKVVDPSAANLRKPPGNIRYKAVQCVYFFGSNNFAWIQEDAIKPYAEFKEQNCKLNKSHAFKEAIDCIEDFIKRGGEDSLENLMAQPTPGNDTGKDDTTGSGGGAPGTAIESSATSVPGTESGKSSSAAPGAQAGNLPSIDEELATIFTEKSGKNEEKSAAPSTSTTQRDYSRTPFKSRGKKAAAAAASGTANDDDAPPSKKSKVVTSNAEETNSSTSTSKSPAKGARNLLARTSILLDSNSANNQNDLDVGHVSAKSKSIRPSSLKFGFIGLGLMGQRLLKNMINSGHSVTIWNRTPSKCKDFLKAGATKATTPADVIAASDVTFSCLADPHAVKEIVFGNCGVLAEMRSGKGYVEMTSIDPDTSNDISEAIIARGGRYLEAPVIGNGKAQAEEGNLTVIMAGDKSLYEDCNSCLQAISKHNFFLGGQVGDAAKMGLVVSMLIGNLIGSLAESMALADRTGLSQKDLLELLSLSPLNCQTLVSKGKAMIEGGFATEMPLTHMQKDLRLALQLAEVYEHPLPITASTNEVFKHAKHLGYSEHDVAAVYIRSRF